MIALRIIGEHYLYYNYEPVLVVGAMLLLLISFLAVSKVFFWLISDLKLTVVDKIQGNSSYANPDILLQRKTDYNGYAEPLNLKEQGMSLRFKICACILAFSIFFIHFGDLLSPLH